MCTADPLGTRRFIDSHKPFMQKTTPKPVISHGVTQRIDGSDSEKKAIKEVLRRMDDYFMNEVLVMPAYETVRYRW